MSQSEKNVYESWFEMDEDDKPVSMSDKQFFATFLEFIDTQCTSQEIQRQQQETLQRYYKPEFVCAQNYDDVKQTLQSFSSVRDLNQIDLEDKVKDSQFFIIRSKKLDDVHKAIKYGVWTSSLKNNINFNNALRKKQNVYFVFTCLTEDYFLGIAQMTGQNEQNKEFAYWGEIGKWLGLNPIKWIYLSNVRFSNTHDIIQDDKIIYDLSDGTQLSQQNALKMVWLFKSHQKQETNLFAHFKKYDARECNIRGKINAIIKTGLYEIAKTQQEEKRKQYENDLEQKKNLQLIEEQETQINFIKKVKGNKKKVK